MPRAQTTSAMSPRNANPPPRHHLPMPAGDRGALPPMLTGSATPAVKSKVEQFYLSVAEIFELCDSSVLGGAARRDEGRPLRLHAALAPSDDKRRRTTSESASHDVPI